MRRFMLTLAGVAILTLSSGCSSLFHPHAKEFAEQAKGATGIDTLLNLTSMMEASAKAAKGGRGHDQALDDLHNQLHAFHDSLCSVDKEKRETPAYALAVTHDRELRAVFKRLWKFKDDQPHRDQHLNLFAAELQEVRETLQTLK